MFDVIVCWGLLTFYAMVAGVVTVVKHTARAEDDELINGVERELDHMEEQLWI